MAQQAKAIIICEIKIQTRYEGQVVKKRTDKEKLIKSSTLYNQFAITTKLSCTSTQKNPMPVEELSWDKIVAEANPRGSHLG